MTSIAIQVAGEYLDLKPGSQLQLEEENPFLQLGDGVQGQYSLPLSIPYTEKNMRLLRAVNLLNMPKTNEGVNAVLWTNGYVHSLGVIKIETGDANINRPRSGVLNIYYLFSTSDFFSSVQNKTLQDVDYGPDIVFPRVDGDYYTGNGFIAHVTRVMHNANVNDYPYRFFPVANKLGYAWSPSSDTIINAVNVNLDGTNNQINYPKFQPVWYSKDIDVLQTHMNEICPFLSLPYILKKAFAHFGWVVDGDIFDDPDFSKIFVLWNYPVSYRALVDTVTFNLKNHVPRITFSKFLVGLMNRFGWWYDFDLRSKRCVINARALVLKNRKKVDYTAKSEANYTFKVASDPKIWSITQSNGDEEVDFSTLKYMGVVANNSLLPAPTDALVNQYYFVLGENAYYICSISDDDSAVWEKSANNTMDYKPDGSNAEIKTNCLVPKTVQIYTPYLNPDTEIRDVIIPEVEMDPSCGDTDTFYICYYFGVRDTFNSEGKADWQYPFAGSTCYDLKGNKLAEKPLVFQFSDADGNEIGIYESNWKYFLSFMSQKEEYTFKVHLTDNDLLQLNYTNTIVINGVEFFIKNPHVVLPLKDFVSMDLIRI